MFRLLVVPISIGILAFLFIYFIAPAIVPEPGIVSYVAEFALYLPNSYFESMPPIIASYIANLNLVQGKKFLDAALIRLTENDGLK